MVLRNSSMPIPSSISSWDEGHPAFEPRAMEVGSLRRQALHWRGHPCNNSGEFAVRAAVNIRLQVTSLHSP